MKLLALVLSVAAVSVVHSDGSRASGWPQDSRFAEQGVYCALPITSIAALEQGNAGAAAAITAASSAIARGEAALLQGDAIAAERAFADALSLAEQANDQPARAAALGGMGLALVALGRRDDAIASFDQSVAAAELASAPGIAARSLYNAALVRFGASVGEESSIAWLGATRGASRAVVRRDVAPTEFAVSERLDAAAQSARLASDFALAARAEAAAAISLPASGPADAARERIARAAAALRQEQDPRAQMEAALAVGDAGIARVVALRRDSAAADVEGRVALDALTMALDGAVRANDARLESYARGLLGRLYGVSGRNDEARALTEQAVYLADQAGALEALFQWQGQLAALQEQAGRREQALRAYADAARTIERVRPALARGAAAIGYASSRDIVQPILLAYTDLLLRQGNEAAWRQARGVVEQLKTIELERYFEDACVAGAAGAAAEVEGVSEGVAIVYPIIFDDRVDLLVSTTSGIRRETTQVSRIELEATARAMRAGLRSSDNGPGPLREAQALYRWLIAPIRSALTGVDTIVFVPDGALNGLPIAALHDGQHFLIEDYAVATAMGLSLFDPRPFGADERRRAVLAGISEQLSIDANAPPFPALDSVEAELAAVSGLLPGPTLLNDQFSVERLTEEVSRGRISVVHLATHAQFGGNADNTFLLAASPDGGGARLTLDDLEAITAQNRIRGEPIELLTLSACETAVGDDNATMGLAGVAFKAGARAVLASLWQVSDTSTARLTPAFYRELVREGRSKAQALRYAQLELLHQTETRHPFHWAAFILVGNWL